jgi:predicted phage terminase large subunit-like protein
VWAWIHKPQLEFLTTSYGDDLVVRDSERSRDLITSPWFQERWHDKFALQGTNKKSNYRNNMLGKRTATSVGGKGTGIGYDILLVDDPLKADESLSKPARQKVINWWSNVIATRSNSTEAKRVIIMQRLHEEDLVGYLLDQGAVNWTHLKLPMEYDPALAITKPTPLGFVDPRTKMNEVLWPWRFPPEELAQWKQELGTFGVPCQLQQHPIPIGGGIIKKDWVNRYTTKLHNPLILRDFDLLVGSWDLTFGDTGESYCVGQVWAVQGSSKFLIDQYRGKWEIIQQIRHIKKMMEDYPMIRALLIEKKANGAAIIDLLKNDIPGIIPVEPKVIGGGDKTIRVMAMAPDFEAGNISIPLTSNAPWVEDWIHEIIHFPKGKFDDQVDATSQFLNWYAATYRTGMKTVDPNYNLEKFVNIEKEKGLLPSNNPQNLSMSKKEIRSLF